MRNNLIDVLVLFPELGRKVDNLRMTDSGLIFLEDKNTVY